MPGWCCFTFRRVEVVTSTITIVRLKTHLKGSTQNVSLIKTVNKMPSRNQEEL